MIKSKSSITDTYQAALVLQVGGMLAAYEAGSMQLYFWIKKDYAGKIEKNVFDIVAGTFEG